LAEKRNDSGLRQTVPAGGQYKKRAVRQAFWRLISNAFDGKPLKRRMLGRIRGKQDKKTDG
jgi:hypothetical protein